MNCIFCSLKANDYFEEGLLLVAIKDRFPVSDGHLLIIPKRHCENFFDLNRDEHLELQSFSLKLKSRLENLDPTISGFNMGANCGVAAGQTVFHCHIHLIPRRNGDVEHPQGGVRGVIPTKQKY